MWKLAILLLIQLSVAGLAGCSEGSVLQVAVGTCPTPDEPYLHPGDCSELIDLPVVTDLVFDPAGGKVPQRVRFVADARPGIFELEAGLKIHWDLDGDGTEDTVTIPGESFYFHYETCETINFHVWATDSLQRIGRVLKKSLVFFCNQPPVITRFSLPIDFGAPGQAFQFQVDAYDPDSTNGNLINGIDHIEWDFDGDGAYEGRTDGVPILVDLKRIYNVVGIYRPKIRVFDEDGDYAESDRLQLSILGNSELVSSIFTKFDADSLVATGTTVVTFEGGGITIRDLENGRMKEQGQYAIGSAPTYGSAHSGDVYFTAVQNDGLNFMAWLLRSTPDKIEPVLLKSCSGYIDHLNLPIGAGGFFGRRAGGVIVNEFVTSLGSPVTFAVVLEANGQGSEGQIFPIDLRKLGQIPVSDNTGSSCLGDGTDAIAPQKQELRLDTGGQRFSPLAVTADDRYLWVANNVDGLWALDLDSYWVSGNWSPLAYKISNGFSGSWQASSAEVRRPRWVSTVPVTSSVNVTGTATIVLDDWIATAMPVTVTADGWPVPATMVTANGYQISVSADVWNRYALGGSAVVVDYEQASLLVVGSLTTNAIRLYERLYSPSLSLLPLLDLPGSTYQGSKKPGCLVFAGKWLAQFVPGTKGASGVYFRALTDPSIVGYIAGYAYGKIEDIVYEDGNLWIAQGDRGVTVVQPPASTMEASTVSVEPTLTYQPGGSPESLAYSAADQSLWVAENRAGLHRFAINGNDAPVASTRYVLAGMPRDLVLDTSAQKLYIAETTLVSSFNIASRQESFVATGLTGANCVDYRKDGTLQTLSWCLDDPVVPKAEIRYSTNGSFGTATGLIMKVNLGTRGVLGPQNVERPRYFKMSEGGLGVFCPQDGGVCTGDPVTLPGTGQQDVAVAPYRYKNLDLLVLGGKNGFLSFWNFTGPPSELGSTFMCDPFEKWLPSNVCKNPFHIRDIDVAGPYAFLATTHGVFVVDLTAAPILRVGTFYTGISLNRIVAHYKSGSVYVAYAANNSAVYTFRFSRLQPPQ